MEMLMLPVAVIATLGGMFALAFRVVRLPLGQRSARPAVTRKQAEKKVDPREPTQALLIHMTNEYERHTRALRDARDLRRSRSEAEAFSRLLNERIFAIEAARKLGRLMQPSFVGRVLRVYDLARLDLLADAVRRENAEFRMPSAHTRPLAGERGMTRWITRARGGSETDATYLLERYHHDERGHFRRHMAEARRLVRERRQAEAMTHLMNEQSRCERAVHNLKRDLQALAESGVSPNITRRLDTLE